MCLGCVWIGAFVGFSKLTLPTTCVLPLVLRIRAAPTKELHPNSTSLRPCGWRGHASTRSHPVVSLCLSSPARLPLDRDGPVIRTAMRNGRQLLSFLGVPESCAVFGGEGSPPATVAASAPLHRPLLARRIPCRPCFADLPSSPQEARPWLRSRSRLCQPHAVCPSYSFWSSRLETRGRGMS